MARIHKGKHDPRRQMRHARWLTILCWPVAIAAVALSVLLYVQCGERLLALAENWRTGFTDWATAPGAGVIFREEGLRMLWQAAETLLRGVGWVIFGLTMGLPGGLGVGLAVLMIGLFRPAKQRYQQLRTRTMAVKAAMKLLAPLPDRCHVFLHKHIAFEDGVAEPEIMLVGPAGVLSMEICDGAGIIEGNMTDAVLWRRPDNADPVKMRNPARAAVANVTRLSNYLTSVGVSVHVTPCVLFVHPDASAYVTPVDMLQSGGRRTRISTCVVTDATSFWEDVGRDFANGHVLGKNAVEQLVATIRKAPEGSRRN